jgi:hypothetical protein
MPYKEPNKPVSDAMRRIVERSPASKKPAFQFVIKRLERNAPLTIEAAMGWTESFSEDYSAEVSCVTFVHDVRPLRSEAQTTCRLIALVAVGCASASTALMLLAEICNNPGIVRGLHALMIKELNQ